jgi:2-hydroxychromene-2-carboxylate isomerase
MLIGEDNLDLSSEKEFSKLLENLKIDSKIFFDKIKQQSIKDTLKKFTNDAFEKEVFGAPTFIVNNKIFWGQDRLEYALEELN